MTPVAYQTFDPVACRFPRPRVSLLPCEVDSGGAECDALTPAVSASPLAGQYFSRGRYALGEACRRAGVGHGALLLAPAYHCVTMLDGAIALGAGIQLYPLTADLAPVPEALDALVENSPAPVKALLATHFFGFVQDLSWLKHWCDLRRITLIEDCSHTLFSPRYQAAGAGRFGHFVASSPYKFFPSPDGGWLFSSDAESSADCALRPAAWLAELRGVRQVLEANRRARVDAGDLASLTGQLARLASQDVPSGSDQQQRRATPSVQYQSDAQQSAALRVSRWIIDQAPVGAIQRKRRANYRRWLNHVEGLPHCRPLYPELPPSVVPYMFPLYIDHPMPHFYWLKQLGVPIWRWDEMAVSDCPVAQDYRLHLLHLPCHQSLNDAEMNWLLAALAKVLGAEVSGAPAACEARP